jgi:hypothetical protein
MLYLLEVDGLVAALTAGFIFSVSGLLIVSLLAWREAKVYAAALNRIYKRRASLLTQPHFFAQPLAVHMNHARRNDETRF